MFDKISRTCYIVHIFVNKHVLNNVAASQSAPRLELAFITHSQFLSSVGGALPTARSEKFVLPLQPPPQPPPQPPSHPPPGRVLLGLGLFGNF